MSIKFGTDGWRAVISDTFTFNNLRLVAQAIADYVRQRGRATAATPEVVIGFDTRFLSDRYATEVARVMAGNGIVAWLTRADAPTPAISYSVVDKKAAAGIMITASHNPPRYNGLKLKAAYGGAASPSRRGGWSTTWKKPKPRRAAPTSWTTNGALDQGLIRRFDPVWAYYEHLGTLVDLDTISERRAARRGRCDVRLGPGLHRRDAVPHALPRPRDPRRDEPRLWRHPPRADWPAT